MKRFTLLKTMLLLCALIVGSSSVWAADPIQVLSWDASGSGDPTYTTGFTFVKSAKGDRKTGYYQDSGTAGTHVISFAVYNTSEKLFSVTPSSITFTAKLGAGATRDPLGNSVKVCFVDKTGAEIAGSAVDVTTKITNTSGSIFTVTMPIAKATDAYGVKIYHTKEDSWNVRYYSFSLSFEAPTDSEASAPEFSLDSGSYIYGTTFTISSTNSKKIYYTTNGDEPTTSSTEYTGAIAINASMTVKALAIDDEDKATIVISRSYSVKTPDSPTFDVSSVVVSKGTVVTISAEDLCVISYTTDGSDPASSGTATLTDTNTAEVAINNTTTLRAVAIDGGATAGEEKSSTYVVLDENIMSEEKTSFAETSGKVVSDISFASYTGGANTDPANYNNGIRLYQKGGTSTYGGYITLTAPTGFTIKLVQITTTSEYATCPVTYTEGTNMNVTTNATYSLAKSSTYTVSTDNNIVNIFCLGSGSKQRLDIGGIKVYYVGSGNVTLAEACTDGENYYGTYSNSHAFVVPSGLTVSEINVVGGKLKVNNYEVGAVVPENTGVMVSSTTFGNKAITFTGKAGSVLGTNCLKASGDAGIAAAAMEEAAPSLYYKHYRLTMHNPATDNKIGFWWGAPDGAAFEVAANKAYLAVPVAAARSGFNLFGDDDTTGIEAVDVNTENANVAHEYYNLNGQRIANPSKGLYIVNGKKVIIK